MADLEYFDKEYYRAYGDGSANTGYCHFCKITEKDLLTGKQMTEILQLPISNTWSFNNIFSSNDGYINIYGSTGYYRYNIKTNQLGSKITTSYYDFCSKKFGNKYYTTIQDSSSSNKQLYVGNSFGALTTKVSSNIHSYCYLTNSYYSEKFNKVFIATATGNASDKAWIYYIDLTAQTLTLLDASKLSYPSTILQEIPNTDYLLASCYHTGKIFTSVKINMKDLTITNLEHNTYYSIAPNKKIQYVNGKYYYCTLQYNSSNYYLAFHQCDSIAPTITNDTIIRTEIAGSDSSITSEQNIRFIFKNGYNRTEFTSRDSSRTVYGKGFGPTLPTITLNHAYAYIKVKD